MSTPQQPAAPPVPQPPAASSVKPEPPSARSQEEGDPPAVVGARPPEPPAAAAAPTSFTITIPSCSGWFSWEEIHETERRMLPEFFDGKSSASRNPTVYKYFRDSIIRRFRANPSRKITFTDARRCLVGDVGSIRRVFDFLEEWGLINYAPSNKPPSSKDKKEAAAAEEDMDKDINNPKRTCFSCKAACSLACFTTDKADLILCARCFVRGNYRPGLNSSDFKRVDFNEETRTDWTDKETLHLLEAVLQHGEDWRKVAEHVGSRNEKECVTRFIKLPFGEQFLGPPEFIEDYWQHKKDENENVGSVRANVTQESNSKRRRLTPLADASNPIMAQVAFLSALVGTNVADAAAHAAIRALHKVTSDDIPGGVAVSKAMEEEACQSTVEVINEVVQQAHSQSKEEGKDIEERLSNIIEIQMKGIQEKILHFEDLELLLEKERLQLQYTSDLLFADQLTVKQHKIQLASKTNAGGAIQANISV